MTEDDFVYDNKKSMIQHGVTEDGNIVAMLLTPEGKMPIAFEGDVDIGDVHILRAEDDERINPATEETLSTLAEPHLEYTVTEIDLGEASFLQKLDVSRFNGIVITALSEHDIEIKAQWFDDDLNLILEQTIEELPDNWGRLVCKSNEVDILVADTSGEETNITNISIRGFK